MLIKFINTRSIKNIKTSLFSYHYSTINSFFASSINLDNIYVSISPMQSKHFEELTKILNHKDLWTYNPNYLCTTEADIHAYLDNALQHKNEKKRYPLVIYDKQQNQLAGITAFYDISLEHSRLSLGYTIISPQFRRTHVNRQSKIILIDWVFKTMNFQRLEFKVDIKNEASVSSLKKFGAVQEGILRSNQVVVGGRRRDTVVLSILKDEWINLSNINKSNSININI